MTGRLQIRTPAASKRCAAGAQSRFGMLVGLIAHFSRISADHGLSVTFGFVCVFTEPSIELRP